MAGVDTKALSKLTKDALLGELARLGRVDDLRLLWNAYEPGLCRRLAPHLATVDDHALNSLLLDELINRRLGDDVLAAVMTAIDKSKGLRLSRADTELLLEHLRTTSPTFQNRIVLGRPTMERWALRQPHQAVVSYAEDVATDVVPTSGDAGVLRLALERVGSTQASTDRVARRLIDGLRRQPNAVAWTRAAEFLDHIPLERESQAVQELTDEVIARAAAADTAFGDTLMKRVAGRSGALEATLRRASGEQQGLVSLARAIEAVPDPEARGRLTAVLVLERPHLYPVMSKRPMGQWSDDEWGVRIRGLELAGSHNATPQLVDFVNRYPHVQTPALMRAIGTLGVHENPQIRTTVASKATNRLQEVSVDGLNAESSTALAWPTRRDDPVFDVTRDVLKSLRGTGATLVGVAAARGDVRPDVAAALVDPSDFQFVVAGPGLAGVRLGEVIGAMYAMAPDHTANLIRKNQRNRFSLEVAEAIAPHNAGVALSGATEVYDELDSEARDRILTLLEKYGTWREHEELMERIGQETDASALPRRKRLVTLTGTAAPKHGPAPGYLGVALRSGKLELLQATFEAIAHLAPRDAELVRAMRDKARADGAPGQTEAGTAVASLVTEYAQELAVSRTQEARSTLLRLLGATGQSDAVDIALGWVGPNALDDHPSVKQAAAAALDELVAVSDVSVEQITVLATLLEGHESEGDRETREILSNALATARLGEDKALAALYGFVGRTPRESPDLLYGQEKDTLLRHVVHWSKEQGRGTFGWAGVIMQLDIVAMCLARAAYLFVGDREPMKAQIRAGGFEPPYGNVISAFESRHKDLAADLKTLHDLRSQRTEGPHPGKAPTKQTVEQANEAFRAAATTLFGILSTEARKHA